MYSNSDGLSVQSLEKAKGTICVKSELGAKLNDCLIKMEFIINVQQAI